VTPAWMWVVFGMQLGLYARELAAWARWARARFFAEPAEGR